ncbi:MAG: BREX-1 system adenine-specific DNA-methyltransferase PglX, partial [Faecousia sp.]
QVDEDDWKDAVQIIGWLYQYYNSEKKDEVFAALKKNVKITKENIPAATQLFTPDWIVRYMVENSLGRLWVDHNAGSARDEYDERPGDLNELMISRWKYYLFDAPQEPEVQSKIDAIRKECAAVTPEQIKCIDPCCGSGHILAYLFDVLMQIYESYGYTTREAVASIVEHNLYGLDIDDRAAQLSYFAVMMKARQYDRRFLTRKDEDGNPDVPQPCVFAICESNGINRGSLKYFGWSMSDIERNMALSQLTDLLDTMQDAKEHGSILKIKDYDWELLYRFVGTVDYSGQLDFDAGNLEETKEKLWHLVEIAAMLAQKYDVVVTNPPYMGTGNASVKVQEYVKQEYPDSKSDLFSVFIERCGQMTAKNRYQAMITQHAWMFLSSFEKLRGKLQQVDTINMAHLGPRAFEEIGGEVVQTTSFVLRKSHIPGYKGTYCRLIEPTTQQGKEIMFLSKEKCF